jgi:16S rRNA (guanine527-N7)-methyltransferase
MMDNLLKDGLDELNISLSQDQEDKIFKFYNMLIEKNKVMNLTRITDRQDFITKHVLDSLLIGKVKDVTGSKILDIGTGAGFPGIPVKIFFPDTEILLLDSLKKRLVFINEVIKELGLENISTIHGRAEDLGHQENMREKFDLVVSRAVAEMSILSELSIPFVKKNGSFVAYKSAESGNEISDAEKHIQILGGNIESIQDVPLYGTDIIRKMVTIKKSGNTPKRYPRKPRKIVFP